MYRSIFLIAGIFFFQVHVDKHLSRQYSLKCCQEHTAGVDIIPTNQSVRNKQERGPHDVQMKVYFQSCKTKFPGLGKSSPSQEFLKDRAEAQCELSDYFELHIMQSC